MKRFKTISLKEKMTIQLWLGVFLAVVGVMLLWAGFFAPPLAQVHPSILTALGEIFTFSGALIGVDYHYKFKTIKYLNKDDDKEDEEEIENE